jgi:hypothetical protein
MVKSPIPTKSSKCDLRLMLNRRTVMVIMALLAPNVVEAGADGGFNRYHLHLPHLRQAFPDITLPETLQVNVMLGAPEAAVRRPLERLHDVGPAFAQCLQSPSLPRLSQPGRHREVTFLFSFRRDGSLIAPPRLTYSDPPAQAGNEPPFADAARAAIMGCVPLPFTPRFASAIAGRPFAVRIIDQGNPPKGSTDDRRNWQPVNP